MKIALCVPGWPPGVASSNGIVTYVSHLAPALRDLGHQVFIVANSMASNSSSFKAVDVRQYKRAARIHERALLKVAPVTSHFNLGTRALVEAVANLHAAENIDVIEIEETFGYSYALSRSRLLPVVVRLHGPAILTTKFGSADAPSDVVNTRREQWERRAITKANVVTSPSVATLDLVKQFYNIELSNSYVIPNPIACLPRDEKSREPGRLLYVGRFDRLKGADLALRAFESILAHKPHSSLTFVGPDSGLKEADGSVVKWHEYLSKQFSTDVAARVDYRGVLPSDDLRGLRASHAVTLVASQYETFPYSVLEAMSFASPIVATAVGGIPEILQSGRNGLLVPAQDVGAMARSCISLLNDRELSYRLGQQAFADCASRYSPQSIAARTVEVYERAIEKYRTN